jgi:hypothetical protein
VLVLLLVAGDATQLVETHTVEFRRIAPVLGVLVDGVRADRYRVAFWDHVARGGAQAVGVCDYAGDVDLKVLVGYNLCVGEGMLTKGGWIHALGFSREGVEFAEFRQCCFVENTTFANDIDDLLAEFLDVLRVAG